MSDRMSNLQLSVIVPVGTRHADAEELYREYKAGIAATGMSHEFIFVVDGHRPKFVEGLNRLADAGERFTVVSLSRLFGEATALMAGFERAKGEVIVTLPAYHQIEGTEIAKLVEAMQTSDLAIGWRYPRVGGVFERLRRWAFHGLLAWVTRLRFHDLGCGARAMKRQVLEEIQLYGDQHRFLAVLADRQGFKVKEVDVKQSPHDRFRGVYRPKEYTRGFLDIFTVFFLVRFTKRPLRFFGMLGVSTFGIGALLILFMVVQRMFFDQALADRPALLLASLLVVLGMQLFAIGLLGELIIFTHARQIKDYQVDQVIEFPGRTDSEPSPGSLIRSA